MARRLCITKDGTKPTSSVRKRISLFSPESALLLIRETSLARLKHLTSQNSPWFLGIAPTTPHIQGEHPPIPLERHKNDFPDLKAPRPENFNASEKFTAQKPSYLKKLKPLPAADGERADYHYRSRIQAIQGLDEIVQDVVDYLKKAGQLDNTYSKTEI